MNLNMVSRAQDLQVLQVVVFSILVLMVYVKHLSMVIITANRATRAVEFKGPPPVVMPSGRSSVVGRRNSKRQV